MHLYDIYKNAGYGLLVTVVLISLALLVCLSDNTVQVFIFSFFPNAFFSTEFVMPSNQQMEVYRMDAVENRHADAETKKRSSLKKGTYHITPQEYRKKKAVLKGQYCVCANRIVEKDRERTLRKILFLTMEIIIILTLINFYRNVWFDKHHGCPRELIESSDDWYCKYNGEKFDCKTYLKNNTNSSINVHDVDCYIAGYNFQFALPMALAKMQLMIFSVQIAVGVSLWCRQRGLCAYIFLYSAIFLLGVGVWALFYYVIDRRAVQEIIENASYFIVVLMSPFIARQLSNRRRLAVSELGLEGEEEEDGLIKECVGQIADLEF